MLVLSRLVDEVVRITDGKGLSIQVKVVDIRGDKVRIGIDAPREIVVDREEIHARKNGLPPNPVTGRFA